MAFGSGGDPVVPGLSFSLSFSGAVNRIEEIPLEKQKEALSKIKELIVAVFNTNAVSGTGSVVVGDANASIALDSDYLLQP
jgi:hypothetical protein